MNFSKKRVCDPFDKKKASHSIKKEEKLTRIAKRNEEIRKVLKVLEESDSETELNLQSHPASKPSIVSHLISLILPVDPPILRRPTDARTSCF